MFTFYKISVVDGSWYALFIDDKGKETFVKHDKGALERLLSNIKYLVGFNNYQIDDKLLASILRDLDINDSYEKISKNQRFRLSIQNPITIDVTQEVRSLEIEEAQANMLQDIDHKQIKDKLISQVKTIKAIFTDRESYFASKFQVVQEFKLPAENVKKTRASLAAAVLKSKPKTDKDRLNIKFDERILTNELPEEVVQFYKGITKRFKSGHDYLALEKERFIYRLNGLDHLYGFGGLHAAKEKYVEAGEFMQIDISSYYPSIIINNELIGNLTDYKTLYDTRMAFKKAKDTKEEAYKVLINAVYGSMKNKYSDFYNPQAGNTVAVNGQLILTHLILVLENFCELIQSNTDGIIIKYDAVMKSSILKIVKLFEDHYRLKTDIVYIKKIAQRDVNNYLMIMDDDSIHAKGIFSKYEGGDFERNSLTIIDKALVDYYTNGTRPNRTIMNAYKNNEFEWFQHIVKAGSFNGMAQEVKETTLLDGTFSSSFESIENVNRVFASRSELDGSIFKVKNSREKQYSKTPYTSGQCFVNNGSFKDINKRKIDLNWYIKEVNKLLF